MTQRHKNFEHMEYVEMDVTEPIELGEDSFFNCIIDKGTLDCVLCTESEEAGTEKAETMLHNMYRNLTPGGCFICVSRGAPETRMLYF